MTIAELAAQRCADEWNDARIHNLRSWEARYFVEGVQNPCAQYRRLVERIHHAIEDFEAGDEDALEPFKLKPPVDPLEAEAKKFAEIWAPEMVTPHAPARLERLKRMAEAALRRGMEIERDER